MSGNRHARDAAVPVYARAVAQWPHGARICVSCVYRGDRKATRTIAGSMQFDMTKLAINQAFEGMGALNRC
ncbi:hypothetical protein D1006_21080 [Burkholderia stabilis]|uniref:Uncharacterized protein n=1 Tax=Burkholderia stabilis TaxID=95485 RepID=A0A4Q2AJ62_9BURK|nr:hypothetical protein D1006_21080 [Burkholderia stabilis]